MTTQVQLAEDEALVLFELLSSGKLAAGLDAAEQHALSVVFARLEEQLVAPFESSYIDQLTTAKQSLVARYGE